MPTLLHKHAARLVQVRTALHAGALHRRRSHAQDALAAEGPHNHRQPPGTDDGLPHAGGCELPALGPAARDADSASPKRLASTRKNWVSGKAVISTQMASTSLSSVPVPFEPAGAELSRPVCAHLDCSQCRLQDAAHFLPLLVCSRASLTPGERAGGSATAAAHCTFQTYTRGEPALSLHGLPCPRSSTELNFDEKRTVSGLQAVCRAQHEANRAQWLWGRSRCRGAPCVAATVRWIGSRSTRASSARLCAIAM